MGATESQWDEPCLGLLHGRNSSMWVAEGLKKRTEACGSHAAFISSCPEVPEPLTQSASSGVLSYGLPVESPILIIESAFWSLFFYSEAHSQKRKLRR